MNGAPLHPRRLLQACAADPADPATQALAGVIGEALAWHGLQCLPLPGLGAASTRQVMLRRFPGAVDLLGLDWSRIVDRIEPRIDEIEDLVSLLRAHADPAAGQMEDVEAVAHALASGSLGDNHLWQDLFMPSRRELSALIRQWFPSLAARNTQDMKWKKFFYKQLCEREQIFVCKAPSCGVCSDQPLCFGPEDDPVGAGRAVGDRS